MSTENVLKRDWGRDGARLRADRVRRKLTQAQYWEGFGLDQRQMSEIERGTVKRPSAKIERAITTLLKRIDPSFENAAAPDAGSPAMPAAITSAFQRIPPEVRPAVEQLWLAQATALASFAENVIYALTRGSPKEASASGQVELPPDRLEARQRRGKGRARKVSRTRVIYPRGSDTPPLTGTGDTPPGAP